MKPLHWILVLTPFVITAIVATVIIKKKRKEYTAKEEADAVARRIYSGN